MDREEVVGGRGRFFFFKGLEFTYLNYGQFRISKEV